MIFEQFNQRAFGSKANATWLDVAGKTLSYGEQIRRCQKLHAWLRVNDVTSDQPVLVAVKNEFERMSLIVALISIGQPTVIFDPNGTQYETDIILSECDFCAVIAEEQVYQKLSLHNYQLPYLKVVRENKNSGVFGRLLGKSRTQSAKLAGLIFLTAIHLLKHTHQLRQQQCYLQISPMWFSLLGLPAALRG